MLHTGSMDPAVVPGVAVGSLTALAGAQVRSMSRLGLKREHTLGGAGIVPLAPTQATDI